MHARIRCPSCRAVFQIDERGLGHKVSCPKCSRQLMLPKAFQPDEEDEPRRAPPRSQRVRADAPRKPARHDPHQEDDEDDEAPEEPRPKRRPHGKGDSRRRAPLVWIGAIGGLAVIGAIVVVVLVTRPEPPPPQVQVVANVAPPIDVDQEEAALKENVIANMLEEYPESDITLPQDPATVPKEPLPADIQPGAVQKVKRSTVYIFVEMADGQRAEGSGFFALEKGIVVTNAHVVGMMGPRSRPPKQLDVVLNSGEPNEKKLNGQVLGVDRRADLALVRVPSDPLVPDPLKVQSASGLSEVQKVYIFGFPLGARLGKQITVSSSTVSSLRKDRFGVISQVQVNGGIHPGNSGGPVVDTRGDVVAVSVAGYTGTLINFGVPADFVRAAVDGKVLAASIGFPFKEGDQIHRSYELNLLDPLQRIRGAKVACWYGLPGPARPQVPGQPAPKAGDSPRQVLDLDYKDGKASGFLILPEPEPGKVLFTQPALVNSSGETIWGASRPNLYQATVERKPAMLAFKNQAAKRKLLLHTFSRVGFAEEKGDWRMEVAMEEELKPSADGAAVNLRYDRVRVGQYANGRPVLHLGQLAQVARAMKHVDSNLDLHKSGKPEPLMLIFPKGVNFFYRGEITNLHDQLADALQLASIPLPNRLMNPGDTWKTESPVKLVRSPLTLDLTCSYEGTRQRGGREEALIRIAGSVRAAAEDSVRTTGKVEGRAIFDLALGLITFAKVEAHLDMEMTVQGLQVQMDGIISAELSRKLATLPANLREILRKEDKLTSTAAKDKVRPGYHKVFKVPMKAGKTYFIEMTSQDRAQGFDPYLRLEDALGDQLDEDDDGGSGLNAQILFRATVDGDYHIIATTFGPDQTGSFVLTVKEG
ncbi:MAG: trypsin-like peptidase domain-containing protein [Gemmataceae bacterium]|nr:trypsin-like peptidase domain-containing protein [Gemmataceae bacterium]